MKNCSLITALAVTILSLSLSEGAVVFNFGSGSIASSTSGLNDANPNATGTFTTTAGTGSAGINFDLTLTAAGGGVSSQTAGVGVSGGSAGSGIDNNNATGPQESITFSISNVTGLAPGETLNLTEFVLLFGFNGGETYAINGGADVAFSSSPETVDFLDGQSVTVAAGSTGDTRFVVDAITVEVVSSIPEPSSMALFMLGASGFLGRRRRA